MNQSDKEYEELGHLAFSSFEGIGIDSFNRLQTFVRRSRRKSGISDKLYWVGLRNAYDLSDNLGVIPRPVLKALFQCARPERHYLMSPNERDFLASLPDLVTIYRGMTKREMLSGDYGISWTLKKEVAEFFAHTYIRCQHKNEPKCVVTAEVRRECIDAFFNGREEQEIICVSPVFTSTPECSE